MSDNIIKINSRTTAYRYCSLRKHEFWSSKANSRLRFTLPPIILADLLGNTGLLKRVQKVMVCCLWFVSVVFRSVLWVSVFQGSLLVIVMMLTAAKNVIMKAAFELQISVYSPIPKCICRLPFNLTGLQVKKFLRNISLRFRHLRTKSLEILLWPKPDVNIPNIFDRFHPWTSDFQILMK